MIALELGIAAVTGFLIGAIVSGIHFAGVNEDLRIVNASLRRRIAQLEGARRR